MPAHYIGEHVVISGTLKGGRRLNWVKNGYGGHDYAMSFCLPTTDISCRRIKVSFSPGGDRHPFLARW